MAGAMAVGVRASVAIGTAVAVRVPVRVSVAATVAVPIAADIVSGMTRSCGGSEDGAGHSSANGYADPLTACSHGWTMDELQTYDIYRLRTKFFKSFLEQGAIWEDPPKP